MAQKVKDAVLSLLWLRSPLWHGFDPQPGNFHIPQGWQKKKKKKKGRQREIERVYNLLLLRCGLYIVTFFQRV